MDRETRRALEEYRRNDAGPIENNLIDELVNGEVDRAEFLRRGTMFGLSAGIIGSALAFVGEAGAAPTTGQQLAAVKAGGTIRLGLPTPASPVEPYLLNDGGTLAFAGIPGEYLTFTNPQAQVRPMLATSWKPNKDATVWTFQLRKGVRFHNGKEMTSADVVASMKQYVGKGSNAGFGPSSTPGVSAAGRYAVVFRLKAPLGTFPYLAEPDDVPGNHPAGVDRGAARHVAEERHDRNGGVQAQELHREESAELVRNNAYWGGRPALDGVKITFYTGTAPQVLALRGGQIDL